MSIRTLTSKNFFIKRYQYYLNKTTINVYNTILMPLLYMYIYLIQYSCHSYIMESYEEIVNHIAFIKNKCYHNGYTIIQWHLSQLYNAYYYEGYYCMESEQNYFEYIGKIATLLPKKLLNYQLKIGFYLIVSKYSKYTTAHSKTSFQKPPQQNILTKDTVRQRLNNILYLPFNYSIWKTLLYSSFNTSINKIKATYLYNSYLSFEIDNFYILKCSYNIHSFCLDMKDFLLMLEKFDFLRFIAEPRSLSEKKRIMYYTRFIKSFYWRTDESYRYLIFLAANYNAKKIIIILIELMQLIKIKYSLQSV